MTSAPTSAATTTLRVSSPLEQVFPRLTDAQIERIKAHGQVRRVEAGETLLAQGDSARIFVITAGSVETVRGVGDAEEIIVTHGVGSFTGEMAILSGRRGPSSRSCSRPNTARLSRTQRATSSAGSK